MQTGTDQSLPRWKKIGNGSFRMRSGRIIKPNQEFHAAFSEIPEAFRDVIICLEEDKLAEHDKGQVLGPPEVTYSLQKRKKSKWWDVVNAEGKPINTKALSEDQAIELLKSLG